jgi:hypothetical protein
LFVLFEDSISSLGLEYVINNEVDLRSVCTEAVTYYRVTNSKKHYESMKLVLEKLSEINIHSPGSLKGVREDLIDKEIEKGRFFLDKELAIYVSRPNGDWCGPIESIDVSFIERTNWHDLFAALKINNELNEGFL